MKLKCSKELCDILEAANTASCLEAKGKVVLESDDELAEFLIDRRKKWEENGCEKSFAEYIVEKLIEKYAVK